MGESNEVVVPLVDVGAIDRISNGRKVAGVLHQFHSDSVCCLKKNIHEDNLKKASSSDSTESERQVEKGEPT